MHDDDRQRLVSEADGKAKTKKGASAVARYCGVGQSGTHASTTGAIDSFSWGSGVWCSSGPRTYLHATPKRSFRICKQTAIDVMCPRASCLVPQILGRPRRPSPGGKLGNLVETQFNNARRTRDRQPAPSWKGRAGKGWPAGVRLCVFVCVYAVHRYVSLVVAWRTQSSWSTALCTPPATTRARCAVSHINFPPFSLACAQTCGEDKGRDRGRQRHTGSLSSSGSSRWSVLQH